MNTMGAGVWEEAPLMINMSVQPLRGGGILETPKQFIDATKELMSCVNDRSKECSLVTFVTILGALEVLEDELVTEVGNIFGKVDGAKMVNMVRLCQRLNSCYLTFQLTLMIKVKAGANADEGTCWYFF
ncbi:hypothetical protein RHMOL_Rhmol02G0294800 [Rhododendron molle]|uniref:Uncharacterized protein n=1 Tax=Rhododendron molle TaxID=49168 RepID=A0ACC0PX85_RHOML|nr:hypothetical protein RHMOL_Rhmol02G0294800 [Rhododendron molle]